MIFSITVQVQHSSTPRQQMVELYKNQNEISNPGKIRTHTSASTEAKPFPYSYRYGWTEEPERITCLAPEAQITHYSVKTFQVFLIKDISGFVEIGYVKTSRRFVRSRYPLCILYLEAN